MTGRPQPANAAILVRDPSLSGATPLLERIAHSDIGVVIRGEPGSGRDVLARTLHALSGRRGALVAVQAAALHEPDLFGSEQPRRAGALERAGTVLLDELGELPAALQAKLTLALELRRIHRLGAAEPVALAARVIATTRRPLTDLVACGVLRHDLYLRINGITLQLGGT